MCTGTQSRVDHVAWKVLIPIQLNPAVPSARANKYLAMCYLCQNNMSKGWNLSVAMYNDKDHRWFNKNPRGVGENKRNIGCLRRET